MYKLPALKKHISDLKKEVIQLEKDILSIDTDASKFYKKGVKLAGIRIRAKLSELIEEMTLMRKDVLQFYRNRELRKHGNKNRTEN